MSPSNGLPANDRATDAWISAGVAFTDAAYERRSLAISSNLHPSGFDELMPKTTVSNLTVDRVMNHPPGTHVGRLHPTHRCHSRQGGQALDLCAGQLYWPPPGSSSGHGWAVLLAMTGQNPLAIDIPLRIDHTISLSHPYVGSISREWPMTLRGASQ